MRGETYPDVPPPGEQYAAYPLVFADTLHQGLDDRCGGEDEEDVTGLDTCITTRQQRVFVSPPVHGEDAEFTFAQGFR